MNVLRKLKVWLGWCPNSPQAGRKKTIEYPWAVAGSEEGEPAAHRIVMDSIMKEELMRSSGVFFLSFIIIGALLMHYSAIGLGITFPLAIISAFIHGSFMVWYRRKEHIYDPAITATWRHILRSHTPPEEDKIARTKTLAEKTSNILVIVILSLTYIYASVLYDSLRVLWLPVLILISGASAVILFREGGRNIVTPLRLGILYLVTSSLVIIHHLVLGTM